MAKTIEIGISAGTGGLEKIVAFEIADLGATASGFDVTGLTDQRLVFQAALDAIPTFAADARTNRVLHLPKGRIRIDGISHAQSQAAVGGPKWTDRGAFEIPDNVTIQGHPEGTTIIWNPVLWEDPVLTILGQRLFKVVNNVTFKDLQVCRSETALTWIGNNIMFYAYTGKNIEFINVLVDGGGRVLNRNFGSLSGGVITTGAVQPIWMADIDGFRMIDSTVQYSAGNSFGVDLLGVRNGRIHNCKINKNSWDGLKTHVLYSNDPIPSVSCEDILITDTELNDNGYGIFFGHNHYDDITPSEHGSFYKIYTAAPGVALIESDLPHNTRIILDYSATTGSLLLPDSPNDGRKISIIKRRPTANLSTHVTTLTLSDPGSVFEMASGLVWDNTYSGVFNSAADTRSFNLRWNQGVSHDFNTNRQCITLTAGNGKWIVDGWGNGEGWDGMGQNITFTNCEAKRNQGTGFQLKPVSTSTGSFSVTPAPRAIQFIGCHAEDNSVHGFGIVNNLAGSTTGSYKASQTMRDITYENCVAYKNRETGFQFVAPVITAWKSKNKNIRLINCTGRSNMYGGYMAQPMFEDVLVRDCSFYGNGLGRLLLGINTGVWLPIQFRHDAPIGLVIDNLYVSGIDPMEVGAHDGYTISGTPTASIEFAPAISNPASPYVVGVGMQIQRRTEGHSSGLQAYDMAGCKFRNIKIENCLNDGRLWFVESGSDLSVRNIATGNASFSQLLDDAIEWEDYYYAAGQATITAGSSSVQTGIPAMPDAGWNGTNASVRYKVRKEDVVIDAQPVSSSDDAGAISRVTWAVDDTIPASPTLTAMLRNNAGVATAAPVDFLVTYCIRRA